MLLQSLAVLAAEEAEPSKTFFYIAGGAFAAFAVALGALGITQPDFPKDDGQARTVMIVAVALMLVAMASAVVTS